MRHFLDDWSADEMVRNCAIVIDAGRRLTDVFMTPTGHSNRLGNVTRLARFIYRPGRPRDAAGKAAATPIDAAAASSSSQVTPMSIDTISVANSFLQPLPLVSLPLPFYFRPDFQQLCLPSHPPLLLSISFVLYLLYI